MATKKKTGLPEDWQAQALDAMKKMKADDTTKVVFGLSFPESWKVGLTRYARNGDLGRMLKVKAISFSGTEISRLDAPEPAQKAG